MSPTPHYASCGFVAGIDRSAAATCDADHAGQSLSTCDGWGPLQLRYGSTHQEQCPVATPASDPVAATTADDVVTTVPGWTNAGGDQRNFDATGAYVHQKDMTAAQCLDVARDKGWKAIGVRQDGSCWHYVAPVNDGFVAFVEGGGLPNDADHTTYLLDATTWQGKLGAAAP